MKPKPWQGDSRRKKFGGIFPEKLAVVLFLGLAVASFAGLTTLPAAAQSAVPSGLVLPIGTMIRTWESGATDYSTPNSVNLVLAYKGGNFSIDGAYHQTFAQFPANQGVPEIMPSQPLYFVRLYNPTSGSNQVGAWIMRAADVRGLTSQQLQDRFALPAVPTMITYVLVPPNVAPLWVGYAGPIAGWGQGGAQQLYLMSKLHDYFYNNPNVYKENTNYTAVENANWGYIPTTSFFHGQLLSTQALSYAQPLQGRGNPGKIGAYLDRFSPAPYSDLENVYTALDYLNFADWGTTPLQKALNQIGPERYSSLSSLGQRTSLLFGDALLQRSQSLRQGLAGGELSGGNFGEGLGRLAQLASVCGFSDPRLVSPTLLPSPAASRSLGLWARGVGEFGNQASGSDFTGFGYRTGGVVGGIDWQPRRDVILGFGSAYLASDLNWNNSGGTASVSNAKFGLYATYFTPRFFLDGVFTGGANWTQASRRLSIVDNLPSDLAIARDAASNSTGHDLALHLQSGINLPVAGWELTPFARLSYFYLNQDAFSEQGADSLNLTVQGFSAQTLRSQLGLRAGHTFGLQGDVKLRPNCRWPGRTTFPWTPGGLTPA